MKSNFNRKATNAVITLKSTQKVDGDTDRSRFDAEADYQYSEERSTISFTQFNAEENANQKTEITVMEHDVVTILRSGCSQSEMIVQVGQTHPCEYVTPMGTLELDIYGLAVETHLSPSGGTVLLNYAIQIDGTAASVNTVELEIKLK